MQEITGDLFSHNEHGPSAIAITTNGCVTAQGSLVMGRGCAAEAKARFPGIQMIAGRAVSHGGNNVHLLTTNKKTLNPGGLWPEHKVPYHILTFPTKNDWREPSDLALIERSCQQVVALANQWGFSSIIIPRPGCGLGQLDWNEVRPICEKHLDDRFFIITFQHK